MKDYGRLLGTDAARAFSARVATSPSGSRAGRTLPLRDTGTTVVVQDPCHLRHVQHAEGAVRTVLRGGYELVELDDDGLCCGAGGAYSVTEPELVGRDPRPQGRGDPRRRRRRATRSSSRRRTRAARCTSPPPASPSAIPPS